MFILFCFSLLFCFKFTFKYQFIGILTPEIYSLTHQKYLYYLSLKKTPLSPSYLLQIWICCTHIGNLSFKSVIIHAFELLFLWVLFLCTLKPLPFCHWKIVQNIYSLIELTFLLKLLHIYNFYIFLLCTLSSWSILSDITLVIIWLFNLCIYCFVQDSITSVFNIGHL